MKRFTSIAVALVIATVVVALGIAAAKPAWLPSWARPGAVANREDPGLFCKEHGVPEKFCTLCHEELKTTLMLCKEHGNIPEDICTLCHPEVEKKYQIEMCPKGHGLPKEFCVECGKSPSASTPRRTTAGVPRTTSPKHSVRSACSTRSRHSMRREKTLPPAACPIVRLASAKLARQVGIQTAEAVEETHAHTADRPTPRRRTTPTAYAEIARASAGFLREVRADLGQKVQQGDVLAVVDSAEVSAAKAQFLRPASAVWSSPR